jgi:3-methyl-2-oxobutanoate hydroxymethyltransferase
LTAYDYATAQLSERHPVDICLVGDSLAQVCLGYDSTVRLTVPEMIHHCKAVARGAKTPFLVADMPFGSYHVGEGGQALAITNAIKLMQEGGMEAVKLEGGAEIVPIVNALTTQGIPVMAHIGLLPQRHTALSGYKVQGRLAAAALSLLRTALQLQEAGSFSMVLEAIPHQLATHITKRLDIPTIGIGAGAGCSGQVLVIDDALGVWSGHKAKFVRRFAHIGEESNKGVLGYVEAVRDQSFPNLEESYRMEDAEWNTFLEKEGEIKG